eukprot:870332-Prorocentrum_minimum.AAC.1
MIEAETKERLEIARLELQWESEKRILALNKLRAWFLDNVEVTLPYPRTPLFGSEVGHVGLSRVRARPWGSEPGLRSAMGV